MFATLVPNRLKLFGPDMELTSSSELHRYAHQQKKPPAEGLLEWDERAMKKLRTLVMKHCGGALKGIDWESVAKGMKVGKSVCVWKWNEMCTFQRNC